MRSNNLFYPEKLPHTRVAVVNCSLFCVHTQPYGVDFGWLRATLQLQYWWEQPVKLFTVLGRGWGIHGQLCTNSLIIGESKECNEVIFFLSTFLPCSCTVSYWFHCSLSLKYDDFACMRQNWTPPVQF